MAGQVLGDAMNHDVCAEFERPHQHGSRETCYRRSAPLRQRASAPQSSSNAGNAQERIRDALEENAARFVFGDRLFERIARSHISTVFDLDAERGENLIEQAHGGAIDGMGSDDGMRPVA